MASGINNAVSRVAGLIAIAVLGAVLYGAFTRALDRNMRTLNLPAPVRDEIMAQRRNLAAAQISDRAGREAIERSFIAGYRYVVWIRGGARDSERRQRGLPHRRTRARLYEASCPGPVKESAICCKVIRRHRPTFGVNDNHLCPLDSTQTPRRRNNLHRSMFQNGALIVLTAPLTETIDHAGYFIQMSMASLPIWLEGILNRKYPEWRNLEYSDDGTARYMPAGVRVLEATLLRHYSAGDVVACYPDDLDAVHRAGHTCRGDLDAQPARRHLRRRRVHVDLRRVETADQRPLLRASCSIASRAIRIARISRCWSAAPAAGRSRRPTPGTSSASTASSKDGASRPKTMHAVRTRDSRRDAAAADGRPASEGPRRHPRSRQADHVRRGRDDDRLRTALPVLRARSEPADRRPEGPHHGGRARERARGQQADLAGDRGHVHLGPGAHRHAVLFPEPRGAAGSVLEHRHDARASSSTC